MPAKPVADEGDAYEFGISQELPYPKGASSWVSAKFTGHKRKSETSRAFFARVESVVADRLQDAVNELVNE